ncbi:MAG TPA: sulfatase [Thermoanaerobaculia bacterium]|nr:sulfatase [Thermoanaerobaculia bacterium]
MKRSPSSTLLPAAALLALAWALPSAALAQRSGPQPRNIVFILSDDHRHDFMGFHPGAPEFLETPALDRLAAEGAHVRNAFVTTSLCSPSRASILTGQYAYEHGVVDNSRMIREGAVFFPELLQKAGYHTAFIGKWHMGGHTDDRQPGFDRWVSFPGQGVYVDPVLNIDGERAPLKGYITDLLTDYAIDYLKGRDGKKPFALYLSHKAVHAEFVPAPRHRGRYAEVELKLPETMAFTEENYEGRPRWVREQRFGWHGVDHMYHGQMSFDTFYRRYAETLLALDESVGRVIDQLEKSGLAKNTLVIYMGDNGFSFGEHGLIDKRHAYEESIRVPMVAWAPGLIPRGSTVDPIVLNVDIAPTLLDLAGVSRPDWMDGRSFLPLLEGKRVEGWRESFVYIYYWDYNFPHTPTVYALRDDRYKYMFYHGLWDKNELYDLQKDPIEKQNLIDVPEHRERVEAMKTRLFDALEAAGAVDVKFDRPLYGQQDERKLNVH